MKILFVAMHESVHTARWISQLAETGFQVTLFSVSDNGDPHSGLDNIDIYFVGSDLHSLKSTKGKRKNLHPFARFPRLRRVSSKVFPKFENRAYCLAKLIAKIKPDVVHSLEMQHSAYLTYEARKLYKKKFPKWIYSCWGSDIYYFQKFEEHRKRIVEVLSNCNYLFTDCYRDVNLAEKYGFVGELLGVYPGVGGFEIDKMSQNVEVLRPSDRKLIVIKSYNGWVYRPFIIIKALESCIKELQGYTLVFYLGDQEISNEAEKFTAKYGIKTQLFPYSSHSEVLRLFSEARISLASSISDGTPNSMLESMVMGAFPIQSDTVSTREWIEDGVNGFLVDPEDIRGFEIAIKRALKEDKLIDEASKINLQKLKQTIDYSIVKPKVLASYNSILK